ncbi:MAG: hypothetical protein ACRENG_32930, partial [bacterium]
GQLSASAAHLRKSIALSQETEDENDEAFGCKELGRLLIYQGQWQKTYQANRAVADEHGTAESELVRAFELNEKENHVQALSLISAYRALAFLLQARLSFFQRGTKENAGQLTVQALQQAGEALAYAEKDAETDYPTPRDFVRAYWLLGEALLQCLAANASVREPKLEIHFYDEPFQQITETLRLQKNNTLHAAERCLSEALRRCRSVNMVERERICCWRGRGWRGRGRRAEG